MSMLSDPLSRCPASTAQANGSERVTAAIRACKLTKRFGTTIALNELDLTVPSGSIFGLLGPNGSGKSTLVKVLTGVMPSTSGEAFLFDTKMSPNSVAMRAHIGIVPDGLALFEQLSIIDHLLLVGPLYGFARAALESRIREVLTFLDLWKDRGTLIAASSYGMKKKTALAMALLHRPKLLMLDEPFESLDPQVARNLKGLLQRISREQGVTIFLTSHLLNMIESLVDTFAIIQAGNWYYPVASSISMAAVCWMFT